MNKIIFILIFGFFILNAQSQTIANRFDDREGNKTVTTSIVPLSKDSKQCAVEGFVLQDSIKYYALSFYFNTPRTFYLTKNDKMYIRFNDGEIFEQTAYNDGILFSENSYAKISVALSEYARKKMLRDAVTSFTLIHENFRHTIQLEADYKKAFENLIYFMESINVSDEKDLSDY